MTSAARLLENAGDKALISVSVTKQKEEIDIENQFDKWKATQPTTVYDMSVNPKGDIYWWWTCITSIACSYNLIFITLLAFEDIREGFYTQWIMGNIICDIIFLVDMWIQSRMFFYENGCKISNIAETRQHYFMSCYGGETAIIQMFPNHVKHWNIVCFGVLHGLRMGSFALVGIF